MKSTSGISDSPAASSRRLDGDIAPSQTAPWGRFLRFAACGAANTIASYLIYVLCLRVMPYQAAYTTSYLSGIAVSYVLNARFVFGEPLRLSRALQYPLVYVVQYFLGLAIIYVAIELLGLSAYLAPVAVVLVSLPVTYLLSKFIITRRA